MRVDRAVFGRLGLTESQRENFCQRVSLSHLEPGQQRRVRIQTRATSRSRYLHGLMDLRVASKNETFPGGRGVKQLVQFNVGKLCLVQ